MKISFLPFRSPLESYQAQAEQLLQWWNIGDGDAVLMFREHHPWFLDEKISWLPMKMTKVQVHSFTPDLSDAKLAIARWYCFADWTALAQHVAAVTRDDSLIYRFESAVEALITGDARGLELWLRADPELARRGARVDTLAAVASPGRLDDARRLLATADGEDRHRSFALAAQHGHVPPVRLLLDDGENPNRYNPDGYHAHSIPLHQAVCAGQFDVVRLLVERGASIEFRDTIWNGTLLGWAEHCEKPTIAEYLRATPQKILGPKLPDLAG